MLVKDYVLDKKYQIIKVLGEGGMSTVYLCKNTRMDVFCAVKEIKVNLPSNYEYKCEVNILKKLNHPGIPKVLDYFEENGNFYMVEEYFQGDTLADYISSQKQIKTEVLYKILREICEILSYLHSFEPPIIYRDLKPSNIMIDSNGRVKLIDFGIARVYKPAAEKDTVFLGSSGFIAPELFNGLQSNILTDIYSFGATISYICDKTYCEDENLKKISIKAMEADSSKRFNSMEEINDLLILKKSFKFEKKNMIIIFTIAISILCITTAMLLSRGEKKKVNVPVTENKTEVKMDAPKEIPVKKDYFVDGTVVKAKAIASSEFDKLKGKKTKIHIFDDIYKIDPQAQAVMFDEKVTLQLDYLEYKIGEEILYCTITNNSENTVIIGGKDSVTLYDSTGKGIEGKFQEENTRIEAGNSNNKLVISFKGMDSKAEMLIFKTDITAEEKEETHAVRLNLKIKN